MQTNFSKTAIGKKGESIALSHLEAKGYVLVVKNYRFSRFEIDLIVEKNGILVFVEVKSGGEKFGNPIFRVSQTKMKNLLIASENFITENPKFSEHIFRLDVVVVIFKNNSYFIEHYENAFSGKAD
ncbi:YraN family protein [bacterium]|nr:YraN family protein [bacterium]